MDYADLLRHLLERGYDRVERDDRLLDIFPTQTREKGIELWERWDKHDVKLLRIRQPFADQNIELFALARGQLESLLMNNRSVSLDDFELLASGALVLTHL